MSAAAKIADKGIRYLDGPAKRVGAKHAPTPFRPPLEDYIPYAEAMRKYGSDTPDRRNPIEMQNVSEAFRGSGFKIFANMLGADPKV